MSAQIKGTTCESTRQVVRGEVGIDRWDAFVASLPEPQRTLASRKILAIEWLDLNDWMTLEGFFFERLYDSDLAAYCALAKRIAERDFSGPYKFFLKLGSPGFIVDRATKIFGTFFTVGEFVVTHREDKPTKDKPTIVQLRGFPYYPWFLVSCQGTILQLLEMTRAKAPSVTIGRSSVVDGMLSADFHCVY